MLYLLNNNTFKDKGCNANFLLIEYSVEIDTIELIAYIVMVELKIYQKFYKLIENVEVVES
jgi:hypothetical protein